MLAFLTLAPFAAAALAALASRMDRRAPGFVMLASSLLVFVALLAQAPGVVDDGPTEWVASWVPALDWTLALRLDGLSLLFALLITGIGTLIAWYGTGYFGADERNGRFFTTLLVFQGGMLVAVLADDFALLFVGWEITSISSFALIGFSHDRIEARQAAQHALLITSSGGLAMLGGLILLGVLADTWRISELTREGVLGLDPTLATVAFFLVAAGAFTKSAQFPFHGWLPGAMAAPTPVSAYLHSATMVKLGVYLVARMQPSLGGLDAWGIVLPVVGGFTMVLAGFLAIREVDLKRVLAYSTVSALGSMVMLAGIGTSDALKALVVTVLAHACYKAALFMTAGTIDHEAGTRDRLALGGLRRSMPLLAGSAGLAAFSMAGLPPAMGFLQKETALAASFEEPQVWLLVGGTAVFGALALVAGVMAGVVPFLGRETETPKHAHEGPPSLWVPVGVLGVLGIALGIAVTGPLAPFLGSVVSATYGQPYEVHLALWEGLNEVLLVSIAAITAGLVIVRFHRRLPGIPWLPVNSTDAMQGVLDGMTRTADRIESFAQPGSLPLYLAIAISAAAVPLFILAAVGGPLDGATVDADPLTVAIAGVIGLSALAAARSSTRLRSVAALGATGFGMTLLFLRFGGPDLAMTQALVETLTVVLFVFAFRFLPTTQARRQDAHDRRHRFGGIAIALVAGLAMTGVTMLLVTHDRDSHLREYFEIASYPEAHGSNVVNTILVDFRALDTLGEITVLAVAATGIVALLRITGREATSARGPSSSLVLRTAARGLLPLMAVFSIFLFFRGHNEPGGGFVAGLVAAAGVTLYAIAYDVRIARRLLRATPRSLIAAGLLVAIGSEAFATLSGQAPLTGQWTEVTLPGGELIAVGTPLFFDLGVFLVVLGVASALATALLEER